MNPPVRFWFELDPWLCGYRAVELETVGLVCRSGDNVAKQFKRAQPANVLEILETLVTLGRARKKGNQFTR